MLSARPANVNGFPTRHRLSETRRATLGGSLQANIKIMQKHVKYCPGRGGGDDDSVTCGNTELTCNAVFVVVADCKGSLQPLTHSDEFSAASTVHFEVRGVQDTPLKCGEVCVWGGGEGLISIFHWRNQYFEFVPNICNTALYIYTATSHVHYRLLFIILDASVPQQPVS